MKAYTAQDVGDAVRAARKAAAITQRELASEANCGVRFISDLERGKPTAELGKVLHVLNVLSLDVDIRKRGACS
jgi:y4mF family transcriptional regulator